MNRRFTWPLTAGLTATALVATAFGAVAQSRGDDLQTTAFPTQQEQARERQALQSQQNDYDRNGRTGNAIFLHPDGAGLNAYHAARAYWDGPDAVNQFDQLPEMAAYRGHMTDVFTGTSNGAATVHAFGYKVSGPGSFGRDGDGAAARPIDALSGFPGSVMRQAGAAGHPIGVVNDGVIGEPGTGAFLAEVGNRDQFTEISRQMILGRPGANDPAPQVILGGGERDVLPTGSLVCAAGDEANLACSVHGGLARPQGGTFSTGTQPAGSNLLLEARTAGYEVVRTRAQFQALAARVAADPGAVPRVLGIFAAEDTFNDVPEEVLIANRYVDRSKAGTKEGDLVLYGTPPGTRSANPPTFAEMSALAVTLLERAADRSGKPYLLVAEPESSDNFGNNNNAIGQLTALKRTDAAIGVFRQAIARDPRTLVLTAADSDGGGLQARSYDQDEPPLVTSTVNANPTGVAAQNVGNPVDGIRGRASAPFVTAPDQFGKTLPFGVLWSGTPDVAGGILSRAEGVNSELLSSVFSDRFDNVDVYRMLHLTMFGEALAYPEGQRAPTRATTQAAPTEPQTGPGRSPRG